MEDVVASSSSKPQVFLSFSGEDVRGRFIDFLFDALQPKGYEIFKDDVSIEIGSDFSPALFDAIKASKCAIVVFSKSYASSSWCLMELAEIIECRKNRGLTVIPVFYHVSAGDLRKLRGEFVGKAFEKHEKDYPMETEMVKSWKKAVIALGYIAGVSAKNSTKETEMIEKITKRVSKSLDHLLSSTVIKDHVGIESRMEKLESYLNREVEDVRVVGIWGIGGIGKTTIAQEAFERFRYNYDVRGIVYITREYREHGNACQHCMILLQNHFFKKVLKRKEDIETVALGATKIKQKLSSKKVLIVLDDVEKPEEIEALVGKPGEQHEWFGSKSRIIVTTRNRELLKKYGDNYNNIYKVDELTKDEGLKYLYRKAFKNKQPPNDVYKELSLEFVEYACGVPSALYTLSRLLYEKSIEQWTKQLEHLAKTPNEEIVRNVLRSSYDALSRTDKQTFLDIARFFNGEDERHVTKILESWNRNPAIGIPALVDRSLISVEGGKVLVLDLLKQMATHIIQEEIKAGKRSWSYHHDDALHALMANKAPLAMTYVHPDNLSGENIKGLIDDGKPFQISFPSDRIPEWFFHRSRESHFEIETSLEDPDHDPGRKRRRKGFALFVVFEIKEHDQFVQAGKLNSISCHFTIDKKPLANSLVISDFKDFMAGSNAVCCYVPLEWFAGRLNTSSLLVRSYVSKKGIVIKLRRFIIHQVFENGIEDFSNRLAQRAPDHLDREKLSDGESQVENKQSGGENSSNASRNETEHSPNACYNIRQEGIEADHEIQEDNENWLMKLRSILSLFCLDVINFLTRKRLKG